MVEIKRDPTPREVAVFGGLCLAFFVLLGAVVLWRAEGLLAAAALLGMAWLASLAFNREGGPGQLTGVALPALFAVAGGAVRLAGLSPWAVAGGLGAVGVLAAATVWLSPPLGRRFYVAWMVAAAPIGWTISHVVLAAVYYLVLTPIGLALRLAGRDPLRRRFDASAPSYWIERRRETDPTRPFKQF